MTLFSVIIVLISNHRIFRLQFAFYSPIMVAMLLPLAKQVGKNEFRFSSLRGVRTWL